MAHNCVFHLPGLKLKNEKILSLSSEKVPSNYVQRKERIIGYEGPVESTRTPFELVARADLPLHRARDL